MLFYCVTPFVGVWIETFHYSNFSLLTLSHPSWVCGLKQVQAHELTHILRHTLRGCVD